MTLSSFTMGTKNIMAFPIIFVPICWCLICAKMKYTREMSPTILQTRCTSRVLSSLVSSPQAQRTLLLDADLLFSTSESPALARQPVC